MRVGNYIVSGGEGLVTLALDHFEEGGELVLDEVGDGFSVHTFLLIGPYSHSKYFFIVSRSFHFIRRCRPGWK